MRTRSITALAVATLALLAGVTVLASCGGGPTTYTNEKYGFSLVYDSSVFQEAEDAAISSSNAGPGSVYNVGFADPDGTMIDDRARDGLLVSVYQLNATITPELMPAVQEELEKLLPRLEQALGQDGSIEDLEPVTVNGVEGFTAPASYVEEGTKFRAVMYFLISGDLEYQVQAQAAASRWGELEPYFTDMIDSFQVTK